MFLLPFIFSSKYLMYFDYRKIISLNLTYLQICKSRWKIMFKYGSVYKQLRKEQEITQIEACKGICSISKLSRWENNQVEVEFSTAIALLRRINITLQWKQNLHCQTTL